MTKKTNAPLYAGDPGAGLGIDDEESVPMVLGGPVYAVIPAGETSIPDIGWTYYDDHADAVAAAKEETGNGNPSRVVYVKT